MKYLIVGLGNIGIEYAETRHNIGFKVVDSLSKLVESKFIADRYGDVAEGKFKGRVIILLKPNTFMNLSGKAVAYWIQKEKIDIQNVLVITDDLALPFGKLRLKGKGSDGGHNGLKSINEILGHQNYARLRCGVGNEFAKGKQVDYVLGNWSEAELATLAERIKLASEITLAFSTIGIERTMSQYNNLSA
jgi:peptidyl-tRNA hydrolase, PTH1 family